MFDTLKIPIDSSDSLREIATLRQELRRLTSKKYKVDVSIDDKAIQDQKRRANEFNNWVDSVQDTSRKTRAQKEIASTRRIEREKSTIIRKQESENLLKSIDRIHKSNQEAVKLDRALKNNALKRSSQWQQGGSFPRQTTTTGGGGRGISGGGGSGISGGGGYGKSGRYISQMPQNPLLGRMAQFGMMASGMAATMFLFQMLAAQLQNLMEIVTNWEKALLDVIDSTSLIGKDMKRLSMDIREYSRNIGISGTDVSSAIVAAGQYGIGTSQSSIEKLYGLSTSGSVGSMENAAKLMAQAGTEFGDRAISQYMEQWETYSGKGKSTGTFGFEWEKLKSSGVDVMLEAWNKYSENFLKTMRAVSDYLSGNRFDIVTIFSKIVTTLKVLAIALKEVIKPLSIFLGLWAAKNISLLFIDGLLSLTKMLPVLAKGMESATVATLGFKGALKTSIPGIVAMATLWSGMKILDISKASSDLRDGIKSISNITADQITGMSSSEIDQKKTEINGLIDIIKSGKYYKGNFFDRKIAGEQFGIDEVKTIQLLTEKLELLGKKLKEIKNIKHVFSNEEIVSGLKPMESNLGFIHGDYFKAQEAIRQAEYQKNLQLMPKGAAGAIKAIDAFDSSLVQDKEKNKSFQYYSQQAELAAGGFNKFEKQAFKLQYILNEIKTTAPESTIIALEKGIAALTASANIENMNKLETALDGINKTIRQIGMTDFEKAMDNVAGLGSDGINKKAKQMKQAMAMHKQSLEEYKSLKDPGYEEKQYQKNIRQIFKAAGDSGSDAEKMLLLNSDIRSKEERLQYYQDLEGKLHNTKIAQVELLTAEVNAAKNSKISNESVRKMIEVEQEYQYLLRNRAYISEDKDIAVGITEAGRRIQSEYKTTGQIIEDSLVNAFDNASDAMAQWMDGTISAKEAFSSIAKSILADLQKMIVKQMFLNALGLGEGRSNIDIGSILKGIGGMLGGSSWSGFSSPIFNASGAVFGMAHGGVVSGINAYSNNIINTPTFVPGSSQYTRYASGGALFGEAGPEAILPLTRMPSGNLGVETSNKNNDDQKNMTNIVIHAVDAKSFNDMVKRNPAGIVSVIEQAISGNGPLRQTIGATL